MGWRYDLVHTFTRRLRTNLSNDRFFSDSQITAVDKIATELEDCDPIHEHLGDELSEQVNTELSKETSESLDNAISYVDTALNEAAAEYEFSRLKWCLETFKNALKSLKICQPSAYLRRLQPLLERFDKYLTYISVSNGDLEIEDVVESVFSEQQNDEGFLMSTVESTISYEADDDLTDYDVDMGFDSDVDSSDFGDSDSYLDSDYESDFYADPENKKEAKKVWAFIRKLFKNETDFKNNK